MKLIQVRTEEELGRYAADIFSKEIEMNQSLVMGLATGSTPLPLYRELIRRYEEGTLDFSNVRSVNLDEYVGLPRTHDQSYRFFMEENLFRHINIDPDNTHLPNGVAEDPETECERYDTLIDQIGGIDLQLLGIGLNGHIGFNEPADSFSSHTQMVRLTESTIQANARFFADPADVPKYAFTLDIRHIMLAKKIVLVAGSNKKDILDRAMHGDITPQVPASALQMHRDITVIFAEE